jgi:hypothetical protein
MAVEPAWHRRARRLRSGQRLLAQVSAACVKLAGHHGSSPPEILRPLLYALSKYAPRPCDVPWPNALISIGSHRSPKTMLMPNTNSTEVAVVSPVASTSSTLIPILSGGEWRPLPFNTTSTSSIVLNYFQVAVVSPVASISSSSLVPYLIDGEWRPIPFNTTTTSSSLLRGVLAGDFRSLPSTQWASLHDRFPVPYRWSTFRNHVRTHQSRIATLRRQTDSRGTTDAELLCFNKHAIFFQYALSEDLPYELHDFHNRYFLIYDKFQDEIFDLVLGPDHLSSSTSAST